MSGATRAQGGVEDVVKGVSPSASMAIYPLIEKP